MRTVLVTGANGFVGSILCRALHEHGVTVRRALRRAEAAPADAEDFVIGDLGPATVWDWALRGADAVIHLAARAHMMHDTATEPLAEYRRINVHATRALAEAAGKAGVRRFIFLSSIKVNGEATAAQSFSEDDTPHPQDHYGISKWEAEQALRESTAASGMEAVVLRAPLLYGPGVKGNFLDLIRAVERGFPLPLASVHNRRSLLYVDNLADAIILCLDHPAAAGKTYLVADDDGVSTPDLIRAITHACDRPARLFPFPLSLLKLAAAAIGKSAAVSRLLGSLQVDSGKIRGELGWRPRCDMDRGLRQTAEWYYRRSDVHTKN